MNIGGQAVLEGVMMRSPRAFTVAVRKGGKPDAEIVVFKQELKPLGERFPFLKKKIIRGSAALFEALWLGIRALNFSANEALEKRRRQKRGDQLPCHGRYHGRCAGLFPRDIPGAPPPADQPARLALRFGQQEQHPVQPHGRCSPGRAVPGICLRHLVHEGHPAGLRVPRRGAQGHRRLSSPGESSRSRTRGTIPASTRGAAQAS